MLRPAAALAAEGRAAWTTKRVSERRRKPTLHRDKFSFDTLPGKTTNRKLIPMNGRSPSFLFTLCQAKPPIKKLSLCIVQDRARGQRALVVLSAAQARAKRTLTFKTLRKIKILDLELRFD